MAKVQLNEGAVSSPIDPKEVKRPPSESYSKAVMFDIQEYPLIKCFIYMAFKGHPGHETEGWYTKTFNKPENMDPDFEQNDNPDRQTNEYGICEIAERFNSAEQPLDWEKKNPPNYKARKKK